MKYIVPKVLTKSFTCPHCGVLANQNWITWYWNGIPYQDVEENVIRVGTCDHCKKNTLWILDQIYFPNFGVAQPPNSAMPESVKKLYLEASEICVKSPRGAAAILRLAVQLLCKELGQSGKNINEDIANLVRSGLPEIVQQSLDIVRVIGNDAVHPGQIDTDDQETVFKLFELTNIIVEYMIALPNKIGSLYSSLPKEKLDGINSRDKN